MSPWPPQTSKFKSGKSLTPELMPTPAELRTWTDESQTQFWQQQRTYWGRFKVQHLQKACTEREMQATGDKVQLMWRLICYTFEPLILGPEEWLNLKHIPLTPPPTPHGDVQKIRQGAFSMKPESHKKKKPVEVNEDGVPMRDDPFKSTNLRCIDSGFGPRPTYFEATVKPEKLPSHKELKTWTEKSQEAYWQQLRLYWAQYEQEDLLEACKRRMIESSGDIHQLRLRLACFTYDPNLLRKGDWAEEAIFAEKSLAIDAEEGFVDGAEWVAKRTEVHFSMDVTTPAAKPAGGGPSPAGSPASGTGEPAAADGGAAGASPMDTDEEDEAESPAAKDVPLGDVSVGSEGEGMVLDADVPRRGNVVELADGKKRMCRGVVESTDGTEIRVILDSSNLSGISVFDVTTTAVRVVRAGLLYSFPAV